MTSNCQDLSKLKWKTRFTDRIQLNIKISLEESNLIEMTEELILTVAMEYRLEVEPQMKSYLYGLAKKSFRNFRCKLVYFATRSAHDQLVSINYYE